MRCSLMINSVSASESGCNSTYEQDKCAETAGLWHKPQVIRARLACLIEKRFELSPHFDQWFRVLFLKMDFRLRLTSFKRLGFFSGNSHRSSRCKATSSSSPASSSYIQRVKARLGSLHFRKCCGISFWGLQVTRRLTAGIHGAMQCCLHIRCLISSWRHPSSISHQLHGPGENSVHGKASPRSTDTSVSW